MSRLLPNLTPVLVCALGLTPTTATAAPQQPPPLVETQRVTAFDLLVELARRGKPGRSVEPPADLAPAEFTVLWDGQPLPVVSLATGGLDEEPWRLVVYVDRVLSSNHTIRWAAMELAERAPQLAELGEVEIVVAEPEPRRLLAASRDSGLIDESLSGLFLAPTARAELVSRREEFLIAYPRGPRDEEPAAVARHAGRVEAAILRRQMDRLLGWLVETERPTSRRALFLVGDGWDLDPTGFYADHLAAPTGPPSPELGRATAELAQTLAAYGWIVAALAPPPPPAGAGRFGVLLLPDAGFPWLFAFKLRSIEVWLDGNRKPKRADALTELGHALRRQGLLDRAIDTYEKAIYHYYDHPKTARRQAAALVALGETLELKGEKERARATFRAATVFDPGLAPSYPFVAARLVAPLEPLARLAASTAGNVAPDAPSLESLLSSLARRVRLTSQLPGPPDGALHELAVRLDRTAFVTRHPTTGRWGTPPAVTRLRLRRLLEEEPSGGAIGVTASATAIAETDRRLRVDLRAAAEPPARAGGGPPSGLTVSWATQGAGTPVRYGLRTAVLPAGPGPAEAGSTLDVDLPPGHLWLALLVEELGGGSWGGTVLELNRD